MRGLLTGTSAGLVLGIQDALTRVTVRSLGSVHSAALLLTSWPAYCLVAVGVVALWLMQSAFNSAPLHASLPGVTAAEPVAGMVLGVVAFREKVPASPLLVALQVAGLLALVGGVILVARSPVLTGLRQYRVPGEHLLRRDREHRRARHPAAAVAAPPPGLGGPGVAHPDQAGPDLAAQALAGPGLARPDLAGPGAARPDLAGPGAARPDLAGPGAARPDLAGPSAARPDLAGPQRGPPGPQRGLSGPGSPAWSVMAAARSWLRHPGPARPGRPALPQAR